MLLIWHAELLSRRVIKPVDMHLDLSFMNYLKKMNVFVNRHLTGCPLYSFDVAEVKAGGEG